MSACAGVRIRLAFEIDEQAFRNKAGAIAFAGERI